MANHQKPIELPEPPEIHWAQIVRTDRGWHLAEMTTKGNRVVSRELGPPESWRPVVEAQFQRWAVENALDRGDEA